MRPSSFACVLLAHLPAAQAQMPPDLPIWMSSEASRPGIQAEVTNLYQTLYELYKANGKLITRKALLKTEAGASIMEMVGSEGLYIGQGENFPAALNMLLCELNGPLCEVRPRPRGAPRVQWRSLRDAEVLIPDIRLGYEELIQVYPKKKGDRISSIVVKDRGGCESYDAQCEAKIRHLNIDARKLRNEYRGDILVPSASYSTPLPLDKPMADAILNGGIVELGVSPSTADRFLGNVVMPPAAVKINQSAATGTMQDLTKEKLLALIKYHRVNGELLDKRLAISLIDSRPYLDHCDFDFKQQFKEASQLFELDAENLLPQAVTASDSQKVCGERSSKEVLASEHGTHLLGLWFSRPGAKTGQGMLPYERTHLGVGTVDYSRMTQHAYYTKVGTLIQQMASKYSVVNLSWGVTASLPLSSQGNLSMRPRKDPVAEAIMRPAQTGRSSVLFVVAAGNDNRRLDDGACDITPVCGPKDRAHVLTVAALSNDDDDPKIGSRSNHGHQIDIGVPAENLWSTIRGHLAGRASGSSQAAATAAAAASMLMYATDMKPSQARNRLIYTSDLTPQLQEDGGKLFGGRLNFAHALDIDVARVVFDGREVKGTVDFYVSSKASTDPILVIRTGYDSVKIPMGQVKRLYRNHSKDLSRPYTVFYIEPKARGARLTRVDGTLTNETLALNVDVTQPGKRMESYTLRHIDDYIAMVPQVQ